MLTRRHIRMKVMQCVYALTHSRDDTLEKQEKFLKASIENTYILYLLILSLLREVHEMAGKQVIISSRKYLATSSDSFPDQEKFIQNKVLLQIVNNGNLTRELEKRKLRNWYLNEEYVRLVYKDITSSAHYESYMAVPGGTYEQDKNFIMEIFKEVVAPNEKIYEYFEDDKLTWVDDLPLVNTFILKQLMKLKEDQHESFFLPRLLKDNEDMDFARELLRKTLLKNESLVREIEGKTPNWDKDRIADIDAILLKMAICELLDFPSIPERVTINEYLEIAKEYSTPKSSIFINGILDKLVREYRADGKLKKMGRGLL